MGETVKIVSNINKTSILCRDYMSFQINPFSSSPIFLIQYVTYGCNWKIHNVGYSLISIIVFSSVTDLAQPNSKHLLSLILFFSVLSEWSYESYE